MSPSWKRWELGHLQNLIYSHERKWKFFRSKEIGDTVPVNHDLPCHNLRSLTSFAKQETFLFLCKVIMHMDRWRPSPHPRLFSSPRQQAMQTRHPYRKTLQPSGHFAVHTEPQSSTKWLGRRDPWGWSLCSCLWDFQQSWARYLIFCVWFSFFPEKLKC